MRPLTLHTTTATSRAPDDRPRPLRLAICTDAWAPQVNGAAMVTVRSAEGLTARGWEVQVVSAVAETARASTPRDAGDAGDATRDHDDAVHDALRVQSLPSLPLPFYGDVRIALPLYRTIAEALDRDRPDLVHCPTEFVVGTLGAIAARRRGIPVVTSYHTDFTRYADAYRIGWLAGTVGRHLSGFHRRAHRTYTPSRHALRWLVGHGITHGEVWGQGVDAQRFHPSRRATALRRRLGDEGTFTFVTVGRLAPEKSVDDVLAAFARARTMLPARSVRLVVVGDGPSAAALRAMAGDDVHFVGAQSHDGALPAWYASADAFVYASRSETLGLVVLEAMASGLPVVAVAAGGVAEHVEDRVTGRAVPDGARADVVGALARAMADVASHEETRRAMAQVARSRAAALDWSAALAALDVSYRRVVRDARSGPGNREEPEHPHDDTPRRRVRDVRPFILPPPAPPRARAG